MTTEPDTLPDMPDRPRDPAGSMLRWFDYDHLPHHLQAVVSPVKDLAYEMFDTLPAGSEKTAGLRKLLEAKDCFVRSAL